MTLTLDESKALYIAKKKYRFKRLDVDCIDRIEVWMGDDELENLLCIDENGFSIDADLYISSNRSNSMPNAKIREAYAWRKILKIVKRQNLYRCIRQTSQSYLLFPKGMCIESLLIEGDLINL